MISFRSWLRFVSNGGFESVGLSISLIECAVGDLLHGGRRCTPWLIVSGFSDLGLHLGVVHHRCSVLACALRLSNVVFVYHSELSGLLL